MNSTILSPIKLVAALTAMLLLGLLTYAPQPASALSGSSFQANRITDDAVFYNGNAMSAAQIQNFLNAKVPVCDTNGTKMHSSGQTRAQFGASRGYPAPYTCLKDYRQNTPARSDSGLCSPMPARSNQTAAQIIFEVGKACNISQRSLIVTLQKEQSLITDDWPWSIQYDRAMGFACPDSGPGGAANCDSTFYGFFNQVYSAARQFQRYRQFPNNFNHAAGRTSFVNWQVPQRNCGGTNVTMQNAATAGLYNYTPYRPNSAALNNLWDTGDNCSAYGNRNYWRDYNSWFGSTYAASFSATPVSAWSSSPTATMLSGTRVQVNFAVRNTGNQTWNRSNTRLGTARPFDRTSSFRDSSWISSNRVTSLKEASVAPGEVGNFTFWYRAPNNTGNYTERFSVVVEGSGWAEYSGLFLSTNVVAPNYTAAIVSAASFKDETMRVGRNTTNMARGEKSYIVVRIRNNGNQVWKNSGPNITRLATSGPIGRASAYNYGWLSASRVANMDQSTVSPGQIATFRFWYRAPNINGTHREEFTLVHEGITWSRYFGLHFNTTVSAQNHSSVPISATSNIDTSIMKKGTKAQVVFRLRNTGNATWFRSNTRLGTAEPIGRISTFRYNTWPSSNRTTVLLEESVAPGEIGTFRFWYQAPNNTGTYEERFTPVVEGVSWIPYSGLFLRTSVIN
jgi:hypothetical protein